PQSAITSEITRKNHIHCLLAAPLFRTLAPLLFLALTAISVRAQGVTLAWDPDSDPTVTGYRLYVGTYSGVYTQTVEVGNATSTLVSNLASGATYYFAVTAYNSASVESP